MSNKLKKTLSGAKSPKKSSAQKRRKELLRSSTDLTSDSESSIGKKREELKKPIGRDQAAA